MSECDEKVRSGAEPVTVAAARSRAGALLERRLREWVASPEAAEAASLSLALRPPTQAMALAGQAAAREWVRAWATVSSLSGLISVEWETRRWANLGTQRVPVRLELQGAGGIADFAGPSHLKRWTDGEGLARRVEQALVSDGDPATLTRVRDVLRSQWSRLSALQEAEVRRIIEFTRWLSTEDVSGHLLREVPLRGVDTKWLGGHRSMVEALVVAVRGGMGLGLREPADRVRVRFLDVSLAPVGLRDVEAPVTELAALPLANVVVLVVENLQTFLALPTLPRTVAVFGSGYGAGARLAPLAWMRQARVLYWGDLDSHGFAVLHQFRAFFPQAESILMDVETLLAHRDLWVHEPAPARGVLGSLSGSETQALALLRAEGDMRLEQERITWDTARAALFGAARA